MGVIIGIIIIAFVIMLAIMGTWQWRNGYRIAGGLSLAVAIALLVFVIWAGMGLNAMSG